MTEKVKDPDGTPKRIIISNVMEDDLNKAVRITKEAISKESLRIGDGPTFITSNLPLEKKNKTIYINKVQLCSVNFITALVKKHKAVFKPLTRTFCPLCRMYIYNKTCHNKTSTHVDNDKDRKAKLKPLEDIKLVHEKQKSSLLLVENEEDKVTSHDVKIFNSCKTSTITIKAIYISTTAANSKIDCQNKIREGLLWTEHKLEESIPPQAKSKFNLTVHNNNTEASGDHFIEVVYIKNDTYAKNAKLTIITKKKCKTTFDNTTDDRNKTTWEKGEFQSTTCPNGEGYLRRLPVLDKKTNEIFSTAEKYHNKRNSVTEKPNNRKEEKIPKDIRSLVAKLEKKLSIENYAEKCRLVNMLELHNYLQNMKSAESKHISTETANGKATIWTKISLEKMTTVDLRKGDRVLLKNEKNQESFGYVNFRDLDKSQIILESPLPITVPNEKIILTNTVRPQTYAITNDISYKLSPRAYKLLFPEKTSLPKPNKRNIVATQELTQQQKETVEKILSHHNETPFIITGAPGCGKTRILIELAVQELKENPSKRILICAPSNNALASIHGKLIAHLKKLNMTNVNVVKLSNPGVKAYDSCIDNCTLNEDKTSHLFPAPFDIARANIILSTPQSSIRLRQLITDDGEVDILVDTLILDEAPFQAEIQSLTPLISQLHKMDREVRLVLCGDPKQITHTSKSSTVSHYMDPDVISRLLETPTFKFNPEIHSNLTENFRYPQVVCQVLNKICYNNTIKTVSSDMGSIQVMHVDSAYADLKSASSHSVSEARHAINIAKTLPGTTRIITCYKGQECLVTRELLEYFSNTDCPNTRVSVGTAESSQGDEADNIILTPTMKDIKSKWLNDPKRVGMILSRCKKNFILTADLVKLSNLDIFKKMIRAILELGPHATFEIPPVVDAIMRANVG